MTTINYPLPQSTVLMSSHSRTQAAQFETTAARSGKIYFRRLAQNQPTIRNVTFRFQEQEAQVFLSWFKGGLNNGFLPFKMDMMTEWGTQSITCRFLPESLIDASRPSWQMWQYRAQLMIENYGKPDYFPENIWFNLELLENEQLAYFDTIINTLMPRVEE